MGKRKLIVLAGKSFFDFRARKASVGGVQTYIRDLVDLGSSAGFEAEIWQISEKDESSGISRAVKVIGVPVKTNQRLLKKALSTLFGKEDRIVVSTDQMDARSNDARVIQIQHGIAFDGNFLTKLPGFLGRIEIFRRMERMARAWINVKRLRHVPNTVCVDYNFFNWIRTLSDIPPALNVRVIPNYASQKISEQEFRARLNENRRDRIIFARRFVEYRGTIIFANTAEKLLREFPQITITFAGDGPLKGDLEKRFGKESRVSFACFTPDESVSFHKKFDIAVVPTISSEGTSLSLLEAMSAGCFPIATHVGGLTNILIDGYNGLMCSPRETSLLDVCRKALTCPIEDFFRMRLEAYNTAVFGFSSGIWKKRWEELLFSELETSGPRGRII